MAMLNKQFFVEGQPSELSLFDLPPTQVGVENIRMENVRPTSTITDSSPILFDISGQNGLEYLDLFNSQIHVKLRVLHDNNSVLAADENVAPVNLFMQSLFSQIDVSIQEKLYLLLLDIIHTKHTFKLFCDMDPMPNSQTFNPAMVKGHKWTF
ncbi:unnamed protein product [Mytilus coruscus]|uniref:Uncharacterized protein n=1 Tax=Mytilus coruscus TaxID=42192 RepID=A0A6J8CWM6_MYTCO|nr:unnamed protein product [Mytilus coruscus]